MLSLLLPRLNRRPNTAPMSTRARLEVCPPSLMPDQDSTLRRCMRWLVANPVGDDKALRQLKVVREEFAQSLDDVDSQHAQYLAHRIRHIRSLRELWHVRSEMFQLIAMFHTQSEAERRIGPLGRHFPTRSPRSGFGPLGN